MNARALALRTVTLGLAVVHALPANKHLALFVAHPSVSEAWRGFGAVLAIALYALPPRAQASLLATAWRRAKLPLDAAGFLLAAAHAVPALDHLPRFFADPSWADAWRGIGAALAVTWFVLPLDQQARALRWSLRAAPATSTARRRISRVFSRWPTNSTSSAS